MCFLGNHETLKRTLKSYHKESDWREYGIVTLRMTAQCSVSETSGVYLHGLGDGEKLNIMEGWKAKCRTFLPGREGAWKSLFPSSPENHWLISHSSQVLQSIKSLGNQCPQTEGQENAGHSRSLKSWVIGLLVWLQNLSIPLSVIDFFPTKPHAQPSPCNSLHEVTYFHVGNAYGDLFVVK